MEKLSSLLITEHAIQKMNEVTSDKNSGDRNWRLALVRTHCMGGRGYTYSISLETVSQSDRQLSEIDATSVYVPESDVSLLSGSELDYIETLQGEGFVVKNPNAKSKCPCGHHDIFD